MPLSSFWTWYQSISTAAVEAAAEAGALVGAAVEADDGAALLVPPEHAPTMSAIAPIAAIDHHLVDTF